MDREASDLTFLTPEQVYPIERGKTRPILSGYRLIVATGAQGAPASAVVDGWRSEKSWHPPN